MSGVRVGSRLEQLLALRTRLDHEIEVERVKESDRAAGLHHNPPTFEKPIVDRGEYVTGPEPDTADVREWAITVGLLPRGRTNGRISAALFAAYAEAHGGDAA